MKNNPTMPSVGIIGGAGPMAGALLFQKIVQMCQAQYGCKEDADFPEITLFSYPFLDMLRNVGFNERKKLQEQLQECFVRFAKMNIVAIACNTLHEFLPARPVSLVHMIEEVALAIEKSQ